MIESIPSFEYNLIWAPFQHDELEKIDAYYCHIVLWKTVWFHLKCDLEKKQGYSKLDTLIKTYKDTLIKL